MAAWDWNTLAVVVFAIWFTVATLCAKRSHWLLLAVLVFIGLSVLSGQLLPNILGVMHLSNWYLVHFYTFIATIFFWLNDVFRQPENAQSSAWQSRTSTSLNLFALASLAMHTAFVLLVGAVWYHYPNGLSVLMIPRLLQLYLWQPALWLAMTVLLMTVFRLHRLVAGECARKITLRQWQGGLLLAMLMQMVHLVSGLIYLRSG